jgi:hypothetical protein
MKLPIEQLTAIGRGEMRNGLMLLLSLFMLGGCEKLVSKPASLDEITKVVDALRAAGCTGLKELDVETDEYEVGSVVCNDGKSYDMKLDKNFNVISKREDHL